MKIEKKIKLLIWTAVFLACLILDLISKHFIIGIDSEFIPGFISFVYQQNFGAAWSMFSGSTGFLIFVTVLAIALILIYTIFSKTTSTLFHVSLGLIVGGALGNLFDRIVFGYVRDFIHLDFMDFPVFNLADSFLTVGVVCLIIHYIIEAIKGAKSKKKES